MGIKRSKIANGNNDHIVVRADCSELKKLRRLFSVLKDEKLLAAPTMSMSSTPTLEIEKTFQILSNFKIWCAVNLKFDKIIFTILTPQNDMTDWYNECVCLSNHRMFDGYGGYICRILWFYVARVVLEDGSASKNTTTRLLAASVQEKKEIWCRIIFSLCLKTQWRLTAIAGIARYTAVHW